MARIPGLLEESGTSFARMLRLAAGPTGLSTPSVGEARRLRGSLPLPARVLQGMEYLAVAAAYTAVIVLAVCIVIGLRTPRNPELEAAGLSLVVLLISIPLITTMHHAIKRIGVGHGKVTDRRWELANRVERAVHPHGPGKPNIK